MFWKFGKLLKLSVLTLLDKLIILALILILTANLSRREVSEEQTEWQFE
jgi:hypothetical protein